MGKRNYRLFPTLNIPLQGIASFILGFCFKHLKEKQHTHIVVTRWRLILLKWNHLKPTIALIMIKLLLHTNANYLNIFLLSSLIIILSSKVPALSPLFLPWLWWILLDLLNYINLLRGEVRSQLSRFCEFVVWNAKKYVSFASSLQSFPGS